MISWSFLKKFQSERLFGLAENATSNHRKNKEGKVSLDVGVVTSFLCFKPQAIYFIRVLKTKYKRKGHQILKLHQQRGRQ